MAAADLIRVKREECMQTKHDSKFSKWKVLVGPSDWEDHSLGKEGAHRYRVDNLPPISGPGVYEIGIAVSCTGFGRKADKLYSDDVVVVYLGQADSVRTRLQYYGRNGAHLHNSSYFDDIFSRGHSILYRWAPMKNKADAQKTESKLLGTFDYAWNKGSNGLRRHYDVLGKLNNVASSSTRFHKTVRKLRNFIQTPAGIEIKAIRLPSEQNKSSKYADEEGHNFFNQIFKFTKSQPKLVLDRLGAGEDHRCICGFSLDDGSVCSRPPVEGRKRCAQHKGLRIRRSNLAEKSKVSEEHKWRETNRSNSAITGTSGYVHDVVLDSNAGSSSTRGIFIPGRVKPQVFSERSIVKQHYDTICGVEFGDGTFCNRQPVKGRVRCEEHKGLKIKGIKSKSVTEDKSKMYDGGSYLGPLLDERNHSSSVCGAQTVDGSNCKRPVKGNTRCWQHSKQFLYKTPAISACNDWSSGGSNLGTLDGRNHCSSVCGAQTVTGLYCKRPVNGNTRCWQHSEQLVNKGSAISAFSDRSSGGTSVCGAPTRNGSYCRRAVKGGGRCWQH